MKKFIELLSGQDIHLSLDGENITVSHNGNFTDEHKIFIKQNKQELIDFLKGSNSKGIDKVKEMDSYPLSSGQHRLWVGSRSVQDASIFNMFGQMSLDDTFEIELFEKAINAVIKRHEILRTVFKKNEAEKVRQYIIPYDVFEFTIKHINYEGKDDNQRLAQQYITEDTYKSFDLESGPLIRMAIIRLHDNKSIFYYNMHHIISDGWSINVMIKEVLAFYEAYKNGTDINLKELRIQYKDYASWQKLQLESTKYSAYKTYWKEKLSGELPLLDLPSSKKRPSINTNNGSLLTTNISPEVLSKAKTVFQGNGGSLFMGLLSTMKILLYKYTNESDIILGSPITGRYDKELENQLGFYLNTLVFRNQIDPKETFTMFFNRIKETTLDAYAHQEYPFDELVKDLELKRDISRSPLFDFSISMENDNLRYENQKYEEFEKVVDAGKHIIQNDISCFFRENNGALNFRISFNTDVYEKDLVTQFMYHFIELLKAIPNSLDTEIENLTFLSASEKEQLLITFNKDDKQFDQYENSVIEIFTNQAKKTPDNTAIVFGNEKLSYQDLDIYSNQLANYLLQKGVQSNSLIPICLDRSIEMIIAILGVVKAGAVYVPIDSGYPKNRIDFILDDTDALFVITESNYKEVFKNEGKNREIFVLDNIYDLVQFESKKQSTVDIDQNQLINIIYTSGTTGVPKGVLCRHKGVVNLALNQKEKLGITHNDRFLQFASFSFDAFTFELYTTLFSGATLVMTTNEIIKSKTLLSELVINEKINIATLPPSYQVVLNEGLFNLKIIISAGEALHVEQTKILQSQGVQVINGYGPTENTVCTTMSWAPLHSSHTTTIGKPLNNVQVYILSNSLNLVPIGVVGELCISGEQIAKGYLNRPELTDEKFVPHPFIKGEKLYRTGDLARWLPDGNIEFMGRRDTQVKIRGYRIELEEVESVLNKLTSVSFGVVLTVNDSVTDKKVISYIISNGEFDVEKIRKELGEVLPAYMIPSEIIELSEFPVTSSGKIDKKKLSLLYKNEFVKVDGYVGPNTAEEIYLTQLWKEVLDKQQIGIDDNFFHVGGDSISAIKIISEIKNVYGVDIDFGVIFLKHPTIKALAEEVANKNWVKQDKSDDEIVDQLLI